MTDQSGRGAGKLVRSIATRRAGDPAELPIEGRLASFAAATGWLSSEPLTPDSLRGRVVLVDFWTYTCVNWLRTLPYVRAWAAKYESAGLTVVGVHTPEFGFEHNEDNEVEQARILDVHYPIALDNDYGVWGAFANHYWPAVYLADADGRLRHHHFGEGEYAQTEMVIQQLLLDAGARDLDLSLVTVEPRGLEVAADWQTLGSPESYLGYGQSEGFASEDAAFFDLPHRYPGSPRLSLNAWDLVGDWTVTRTAAALNAPGGRVAFRFRARDVNLVMAPAERGRSIPFRVSLDGNAVADAHGTDVDTDGRGILRAQATYQLVRSPEPIADRLVEIEFLEAGAQAYCFTFG